LMRGRGTMVCETWKRGGPRVRIGPENVTECGGRHATKRYRGRNVDQKVPVNWWAQGPGGGRGSAVGRCSSMYLVESVGASCCAILGQKEGRGYKKEGGGLRIAVTTSQIYRGGDVRSAAGTPTEKILRPRETAEVHTCSDKQEKEKERTSKLGTLVLGNHATFKTTCAYTEKS